MTDLEAREIFKDARLKLNEEQLMTCPRCLSTTLIIVGSSPTEYECQSINCRPDKKTAGYRFTLTSNTLLAGVKRFRAYQQTADLVFKNRNRNVTVKEVKKYINTNSTRLAAAALSTAYRAMLPPRHYSTAGTHYILRLGNAHIALQLYPTSYAATRDGNRYPSAFSSAYRYAAYHDKSIEFAGFLSTYFCPPAGHFIVVDAGFRYSIMTSDPQHRNHTSFPRPAFLKLPHSRSLHYRAIEAALSREKDRYNAAASFGKSRQKNYGRFLCEYMFYENLADQSSGLFPIHRDLYAGLITPRPNEIHYPISRPLAHGFPPHSLWPK